MDHGFRNIKNNNFDEEEKLFLCRCFREYLNKKLKLILTRYVCMYEQICFIF